MITLVLAGLLGVFIWYVLYTTPQQYTPAPIEISMSSTGYKPGVVEIAPNTKVTFKNSGTDRHWPATDNHPTHTLYDGTSLEEHCALENNDTFDACGAIKPSENWTFIFYETGRFTYHDHLWPHLQGEIIVKNEEQQASGTSYYEHFVSFGLQVFNFLISSIFGTLEVNERTVANNPYTQLVVESDPSYAIAALKHDSASSSELYARCHEVLHDIGKEAFYQYGSFGSASVFQSDFCNSGYIHGVFEAHFLEATDPNVGLAEACENYAAVGGRPFDLWQCHHGVGHGFMYFTGGDVLNSLLLCQGALKEETAIGDCHNGVYMELFNSEILAKETAFLNSSEPGEICASMTISPSNCYVYLATHLMQNQKLNLAEVFATCDTVPNTHRDACKLGSGAESMKRVMGNPQAVFTTCSELKSLRDQTLCVAGATTMYVNQTASLAESYRLCKLIPLVYQEACRQVVDGRVSDFKPQA